LKGFPGGDQPGHLAGRIIQIAEVDGLPFAADNAERLQTLVDSVHAEAAFFYLLRIRVVMKGVKGTDFHACFTSIANRFVQYNRTIFSFNERLLRADIHTGRGCAVIAELW